MRMIKLNIQSTVDNTKSVRRGLSKGNLTNNRPTHKFVVNLPAQNAYLKHQTTTALKNFFHLSIYNVFHP